ncbi:MAG: hypothetical protein IAC32_04130 [Bacteroidetes bacterium]|uniref:Uncharacterized protein n=1 Tax=Candidatus Enterocola intestinipullorum TaxID=2840783 RepID=A0A9D9EF09_9BACT|nr:hypothetical protein [Candidatus Enterocola intestinipullorum]
MTESIPGQGPHPVAKPRLHKITASGADSIRPFMDAIMFRAFTFLYKLPINVLHATTCYEAMPQSKAVGSSQKHKPKSLKIKKIHT